MKCEDKQESTLRNGGATSILPRWTGCRCINYTAERSSVYKAMKSGGLLNQRKEAWVMQIHQCVKLFEPLSLGRSELPQLGIIQFRIPEHDLHYEVRGLDYSFRDILACCLMSNQLCLREWFHGIMKKYGCWNLYRNAEDVRILFEVYWANYIKKYLHWPTSTVVSSNLLMLVDVNVDGSATTISKWTEWTKLTKKMVS